MTRVIHADVTDGLRQLPELALSVRQPWATAPCSSSSSSRLRSASERRGVRPGCGLAASAEGPSRASFNPSMISCGGVNFASKVSSAANSSSWGVATVAAAESAIGLAILVVLFRNRASIAVDELDTLKG